MTVFEQEVMATLKMKLETTYELYSKNPASKRFYVAHKIVCELYHEIANMQKAIEGASK